MSGVVGRSVIALLACGAVSVPVSVSVRNGAKVKQFGRFQSVARSSGPIRAISGGGHFFRVEWLKGAKSNKNDRSSALGYDDVDFPDH